jgi:polyisoprenoid-binding protein YceI
MKHSFAIIFFLVFAIVTASAQKQVPVQANKAVRFTISNFGFDVSGEFSGLTGSVSFDEKNLSSALFDVKVSSNAVNTNNKQRDKHLRGEDYFNTSLYPEIQIQSTRIAKSVTPGYYVFFGTLTMKGKTKEINFPFTAVGEGGGYRFKGNFKIKRKDFGVGGNSTISNELTVYLDVLTKIP